MASISSKRPSGHDVFLSFCGQDTRKTVVSCLYEELERQLISTFKDDEKLERGAYINDELFKAIEDSKVAVVFVSMNFSSSSFCMRELAKILECRRNGSLYVLPVFYDVEPSEARKRTGSLQKALENHRGKHAEFLETWAKALTEAADISGEHSKNWKNDAELIKVILKDVNAKLNGMLGNDYSDLVGMDRHMQSVLPLLSLESQKDVRMIGICGMGGIGKTELAKYIYYRFSNDFEASCFIRDVKEIHKEGEWSLKKRFLSEILKTKEISISAGVDVCSVIKNRLSRRKVLVILDDVDKQDQLNCLARAEDWFGAGSRIIVTCRDKMVLHVWQGCLRYDMMCLEIDDAVKLFLRHACYGEAMGDELWQLSYHAAAYAGRLPLALKVFGSHLRGKEIGAWDIALAEHRENLPVRIKSAFKASFDGLEQKAKDIFLYIACAFGGQCYNQEESVLKGKHSNVEYWIDELANRSLLDKGEGDGGKYIKMHDILAEMGREIDCEQSGRCLGKRQFLMRSSEVFEVLESKSGTDKVEVIDLDARKFDGSVTLGKKAFKKMSNLRILKIWDDGMKVKVELLEYLPSNLVVLSWYSYPLTSLPNGFRPKCLVELFMPESKVERLWEGGKFPHLKKINLIGSKCLKQFPDLSTTPNLEELNLQSCFQLVEVSCSIKLPRLITVLFGSSWRMKIFPLWQNMIKLRSLVLSRCRGLKIFPDVSRTVKYMELDGTGIEELPSEIGFLSELEWLDVSHTKIRSISETIQKMRSLKKLGLVGCYQITSLPKLPYSLEFVRFNGRLSMGVKNTVIIRNGSLATENNWDWDEYPNIELEQIEEGEKVKKAHPWAKYKIHIKCLQNRLPIGLLEDDAITRSFGAVDESVRFGGFGGFGGGGVIFLRNNYYYNYRNEGEITFVFYDGMKHGVKRIRPLFVEDTMTEEDWGTIIEKVWEEFKDVDVIHQLIHKSKRERDRRPMQRCKRRSKMLEKIKDTSAFGSCSFIFDS